MKTHKFDSKISSFYYLIKNYKIWTIALLNYLNIDNRKYRIHKLEQGIKYITRTNVNSTDIGVMLFQMKLFDYYPLFFSSVRSAIDIGSHIGSFSIMIVTNNPDAYIYAYEPQEDNYNLLTKNVKLNSIKTIFTNKVAVSDKKGQSYLMEGKNPLQHTISKYSVGKKKYKIVKTTTLKGIFKEYRLRHCDLVKLNCEGSEYDIIYSTPKSIFDKIQKMIIHVHNVMDNKLEEHLTKQGFKIKKEYFKDKKYCLFFCENKLM